MSYSSLSFALLFPILLLSPPSAFFFPSLLLPLLPPLLLLLLLLFHLLLLSNSSLSNMHRVLMVDLETLVHQDKREMLASQDQLVDLGDPEKMLANNYSKQYIIGASLSEPHTSVTSLHPCVCILCLLACAIAATTYRKSLPALILRGYVIR